MVQKVTFFTICSKNFTAYAKTLFDSVCATHPGAENYLFLCDALDDEYRKENFDFDIVTIDELQIEQIAVMAQRYNITEFNTAIKPFAFKYLFENLGKERVIYLDPDILVISPLDEVIHEFERGAECILTPHILEPAENLEMTDIRFLQMGIYNLGFIGLQKTKTVIRAVDWWSRQLVDKCLIDLPKGLFVDQKWADLFPAFIQKTSILHHPGYNVAYWNLPQRKVELVGGVWSVNKQPLRFIHFSGHQPGQFHFSRHSGVLTRDNIGDLGQLVDLYYEKIIANGHDYYSKQPYAFNWNGASGINLHTPQPILSTQTINRKTQLNMINRLKNLRRKIIKAKNILKMSVRLAGGWFPLIKKTVRAFMREGISGIIQRYKTARSYTDIPINSSFEKDDLYFKPSGFEKWVPRLLFIDWSTPRPDQDAGSVSSFNILKIYTELGYDVTFIPSDLQYLGEYTEALRNLGIRCLNTNNIQSIKNHLQIEGSTYQFVLICRAPIADLYLSDIRQFAPQAKIILDTVDLHYLREIRAAELDGDPKKMVEANAVKNWELDIFRKCDLTILLSTAEYEILRDENPDINIRMIPLIFVDPVFNIPSFEERSDFLFIGGFRHLPNIDAAIYFCQEILPLVHEKLPKVKFHIIGSDPPLEILALEKIPGVVVHGFVKEITPIFQKSKLSVAPLRFGAGIKGKITTSMAYGVPVIATSLAAEGMQIEDGEHIIIADTPQQFADRITSLYNSKEIWTQFSNKGREQVFQVFSPPAIKRNISLMMQDLNPTHKQLDFYVIKSHEEYSFLKKIIFNDIQNRTITEIKLIEHDQPNFFIDGFCAVCGCESQFNTSFMYSYAVTDDNKPIPNWREHLGCIHCGFQNRIRATIQFFYQYVKPAPNADIYITEQVTALFKWLQKQHPQIIGSEYLGAEIPFGASKNGIRNEDMTALTFADNSFDYILSFDVLEHVNDDIRAFQEVYRSLKPGGTFVFSVPFMPNETEKQVRARMSPDGSIEHILAPEYHGNPVDHESGSLCFRYFAWDMINDLKSIGFNDVSVLNYWSRDFAYLGVEQFLFIAKKKDE
jgi:glycosyltransferase involved in cell wall biosynthesis/SAM-dependent methyltransferase